VNDMAGHGGKPVIYISAMSIGFTEFTKALRQSLSNITVMQGMDRAVTAIKSLIDYARLRKEVPDIASSSKASARKVLEKALKQARGAALDEVASKALLKAYGIPVSREAIAQTAAEAVLIAKQIKADLELVVGASLDAEMGPVVLFGTGGVDIELLKDVALAGAPLD